MRAAALSTIILLAAIGLAAAVPPPSPPPAAAGSFTPEQRREVVTIVRDALKSDPTILRDAVAVLEADNQVRAAQETAAKIASHQKELTATFGDPVAGNPNGDVTIVEFYDPRCPYCRRVMPDIEALLKKDGNIRWVYKDIPVLGPNSVRESRAILAAGKQGAYLRMQSALMTDSAQPSDEMLAATAKQLGIDPKKLEADMDSQATTAKINANLALARTLDISGTPAFVVGDKVIPGAVDLDALEQMATDARKHGHG